jgi:hypothetical protein
VRCIADRHGPDGVYVEKFDADSLEHAEQICKEKGWEFVGYDVKEFSADEMSQSDMDEMCRQLNNGGLN